MGPKSTVLHLYKPLLKSLFEDNITRQPSKLTVLIGRLPELQPFKYNIRSVFFLPLQHSVETVSRQEGKSHYNAFNLGRYSLDLINSDCHYIHILIHLCQQCVDPHILWIFTNIISIERALGSNLCVACTTRRNDYSKYGLFHCSYGHI